MMYNIRDILSATPNAGTSTTVATAVKTTQPTRYESGIV